MPGILAASALAPGCPDAVLGAADAASGDPRRPGLGVSASGDDESEDAARLEFQRRNVDLGPSIDPKFLNIVLERVPGAALKQLQDIGKHQRWDALLVGDVQGKLRRLTDLLRTKPCGLYASFETVKGRLILRCSEVTGS